MSFSRPQQFIEEAIGFLDEHHRSVVGILSGISFVYHLAILLSPLPYSPLLFYPAVAISMGLTAAGLLSQQRKKSMQTVYNFVMAIAFFWQCVHMVAGVSNRGEMGIWMVIETLLLSLLMLSFLPPKRAVQMTVALCAVFTLAGMSMQLSNISVILYVWGLVILSTYLTFYGPVVKGERQRRDKLQQELRNDGLTGVLNRRTIEADMHKILKKRNSGLFHFVMMLDLDHFKGFNDEYGHLIGDRVLQSAARAMEGVIGKKGSLGRWGGEEFIAWIKSPSPQEALEVAEALRARVTTLHVEENDLVAAEVHSITISIGMSELRPGEMLEEAIERADGLLYTAKRSGRNRVVSDVVTEAAKAPI